MNPIYHNAAFMLSAVNLKHAPAEYGAEVAFAGRSNSGKSSAINAIIGQNKLARVSKILGRTQCINFFSVTEERRIVDLPGYGYAKVAESVKQQWQKLLQNYLHSRMSLKGLILVMDIRHPLTDFDSQMLAWCQFNSLPVHILLTKCDKLNKGPANETLRRVRDELGRKNIEATLQLFSAQKFIGIDEVHQVLDHWLGITK